MTLYIITLEPIEKRYTKQWYDYFKPEFRKHFGRVKYIDGNFISDKIETGRFLDINKTNIWKAEQVQEIGKLFSEGKIKNKDMFFFMDAWHFGITAVKYMAQLNGINPKLFGYWHAGTYDPNDFVAQAGLTEWAKYNETGWMTALDINFVATEYHKNLIMDRFLNPVTENHSVIFDKIKVVGFPMDWEAEIKKIDVLPKVLKKNIVVFPHRVDPEKQPDVFDELANKFPEYKFVKTMEITDTKEEYYKILADAKYVFSANLQETFGIGTVEAMLFNCIPIVPNRLTYPEMYEEHFLYTNKPEQIIKNWDSDNTLPEIILKRNKQKIINDCKNSISKMAELMKNG